MPQLSARFAGLTERSGRLAYGHANIVRAITQDDDQTREILTMVFDVPDLPPERVVELIAVLLERHESLRTTYRLGSVSCNTWPGRVKSRSRSSKPTAILSR